MTARLRICEKGYFDLIDKSKEKRVHLALQRSFKDFTIIIYGQRYPVNKRAISALSIFIDNVTANDPNIDELTLDFSDDKNYIPTVIENETYRKMFNVINGYSEFFDNNKELKYLIKFSQILEIELPPCFSLNSKPRYKSDSNIHEIFLGGFLLLNFINSYPKNITVNFGESVFKSDVISLSLSDIMYSEIKKNPRLDSLQFDLDNSNNELEPLINYLTFNKFSITIENADTILEAAERLQISSLVDIIKSFQEKYEENQNLYEKNEEKLNYLIDLQEILFNLSEKNFENSFTELTRSVWVKSRENVKELVTNICNAYMYQPNSRPFLRKMILQLRQLDSLSKMNDDDFFTQFLVNYSISISSFSLLICPLICDLYEKDQIISKDTLTRKIYQAVNGPINLTNKKYEMNSSPNPSFSLIWFLPEMEEKYPLVFDQIKSWNNQNLFAKFFLIMKNNIVNLRKNNWELFKKYRESLLNPDPFAVVITNDDLEKFQIMSNDISFNFSYKLKEYLFENIDQITLIDYAALHASIKCFKYMLINGGSVTNTTYYYAVIGGSIEIIRLVDNELGDIILNDPRYQNVWRNDLSFIVPYGSCHLLEPINNEEHYFNMNLIRSVRLQTVLNSCIMHHRNDVFEWLMDKFKKSISSDILFVCFVMAITYNNMKIVLLIIDSGLLSFDDKERENYLKNYLSIAAINGFSEAICLIISIYGKKLIDYSQILNDTLKIQNFNIKIHIDFWSDENIYSSSALFGSIKLIKKLKKEFKQISSDIFITSMSKSIFKGNFDFANFILNLYLFGIDSSSYDNEISTLSDSIEEDNDIIQKKFLFSKIILKEWILNAIRSCNKENVSFVEKMIETIQRYEDNMNSQMKVSELIDSELASSFIQQAAISNDIKFLGWILSNYSKLIDINSIENSIEMASKLGGAQIINICLAVISCIENEKEIKIDIENPKFDNKGLSIKPILISKSMKNASKYGFYNIIQIFIEKFQSLSSQFIDETFEIAMNNNRTDICKSLLTNVSFSPSHKLLLLSAKSNSFEIFKKILEINHSSEFLNTFSLNETLLTQACKFSSIEFIKYLLENYLDNLDPNLKNFQGLPPLVCAASHRRMGVISLLCDKFKTRIDSWQLNSLIQVYFRRKPQIEKLESINPNLFEYFNPSDYSTIQEVFCVSSADDLDLCYFLSSKSSEYSIDWNYLSYNRTPLMTAAMYNNFPLMQFLLSKEELDVNMQDSGGNTAIMIASYYDHQNIVEKLLEDKRVNIGLENYDNETVLMKCIRQSRSSKLLGIILNSAKCTTQISQRQLGDALYFAIKNENIGCVNCLLSCPNIDVNYMPQVVELIDHNYGRRSKLMWKFDILTLAASSSLINCDYLTPIVNHTSFDMSRNNVKKALVHSVFWNNQTLQTALTLNNGDINVVDAETGYTPLMCSFLNTVNIISPDEIINTPNFDAKKSYLDAFGCFAHVYCSDFINAKFGPPPNNGNNENNNSSEFDKYMILKSIKPFVIPSNYILQEKRTPLQFNLGNATGLTYCLSQKKYAKSLSLYQDVFDPNLHDHFGYAPFMYAAFFSPDCADFLKKIKKADVNCQNSRNRMTPLMYACAFILDSVPAILRNERVDVSIKDFAGLTAFDHLANRFDLDVDEIGDERPKSREEFMEFYDNIIRYIKKPQFDSDDNIYIWDDI